MQRHVCGAGRRYFLCGTLIVLWLSGLAGISARAQTFADPGFSSELVTTLPPFTPVGLAFAPDGRMFVWQRDGVVRIFKNGVLLPTPFINIGSQVNQFSDRGMLGLALHPNFAGNGFVYLLFTREEAGNPSSPDAKVSRLIRVTADPTNPDVALPGSEITILGSVGTPPCSAQPPGADCIPSDSNTHSIGTLRFAPDGKLFVGSGDGASAAGVDPLAFRSQDLTIPSGKILRINEDGSAPGNNPFDDGTNSWQSKVWVYGLRNPYRFALHPTTGELFIGDMGWNTWEEIDKGTRGENFGWPCFEGNLSQPEYQSQLPACTSVPSSGVTPPLVSWAHDGASPSLPGYDPNFLGAAAIGGTFYTGSVYPQIYSGSFFYADSVGGWIRRLVLDAAGNLTGNLLFATGQAGIVSLEQGPDGLLYYLGFATGEIRRIRFNAPDTTPPTAPAGLAATAVGATQINLTWNASTDNVGVSGYQLERCQGAGCTGFVLIATVAGTSFNDTGRTANTSYSYRVRATDAAGNFGSYSNIATAATPVVDTTLPTTPTGLAATAVSPTQINLTWNASTDNVGVTGYQIDRCQGTGCTTFAQIATSTVTSFGNTGLAASTTYRYRVRATDAAGNLSANSGIVTATTVPDTTLPTTPTGLAATAISPTQINLTWNASTDNVGVTGYRVFRCTGATCTPSTQIATSTVTSFSNTGLAASTTYRYRVRAVDAAGNLSANSSIVTATTPAVPDTTAPSVPAGLAATAVSATQINLSWTAATDNVGVSGYQLERCQDAGCTGFALIATLAGTTFTNTGLTASTSYSYRVRASDAAGNLSGYSNVASATTPIPDTTPPGAPAGLAATAIGAAQINLSWTAATDNVAVSGYQLERCQGAGCTAFALIATVAGTTFNDTGRTANTSYSYRVRATDATGNIGAYSNIAAATTAAIPFYTTNFDLTENPISEGGVWHRASNVWTNVSTANGIAFGTNGITNTHDDSYALLSGFGPNQQAEAVIFRSPNLVRGITHEVGLLLRFSDDANNARGYECTFNYLGDVQLARWNGAPGDVTPMTITGGAGGLFRDLVSGDVIKATIVGNLISLYINGVLMGQATDSTFASGQPGIAFFTRPGGSSANLGLASYTVSSN